MRGRLPDGLRAELRRALPRMHAAATQPATYADIEALPGHLVGEILFGNLVTHPRPHRRHAGAASALGAISTNAYQFGVGRPGGWIFVDEPDLHLGPHIAVPDIAGWRRERMNEPAEQAYFEISPDWICEVLSPSTEKYGKGEKRRIYAAFGVAHLWHLDPRAHTRDIRAARRELAADAYLRGHRRRLRSAVRRDQILSGAPLAFRPAIRPFLLRDRNLTDPSPRCPSRS